MNPATPAITSARLPGWSATFSKKSIPLPLLLLISGDGWGKGIRQFGRDLGLASFKGRGDCTGQPAITVSRA